LHPLLSGRARGEVAKGDKGGFKSTPTLLV